MFVKRRWLFGLMLACGVHARVLAAQVLTLEAARARAVESSPALAGSRESIVAAAARARQAGAFPNPVLTYSREQTSRAGQTNWQNIGLVEQRLDFGGQRGARQNAASRRRDAAISQRAAVEAEVLFEVTRAYVQAVAADRRAVHAGGAAEAFARARRISAKRRAQGDVSGYADRRIALEAARYAVFRAEAQLARHRARLALGALLTPSADSLSVLEVALEDSLPLPALTTPLDSLKSLALQSRGDLKAAEAELVASEADARAARREAFPTPTAGIGFKNEKTAADLSASSGVVLQLSLPVPLWDGRRGASDAFQAEGRQRAAEAALLRREILREVETARVGMDAAGHALEAIRPQLGTEAARAVAAAEAAYAEGEITLVEWLDAVRAYQEAETMFTTLQADYLVQRAALERAVGARLP